VKWTNVARTLEELGIEPMMAAAATAPCAWSWAADLGLARKVWCGEFPKTYRRSSRRHRNGRRPRHDHLRLDRPFGQAAPRRSRRATSCQGFGRAASDQRDVPGWALWSSTSWDAVSSASSRRHVGGRPLDCWPRTMQPVCDGRHLRRPTRRSRHSAWTRMNLARGGHGPQAAGYILGSLIFCLAWE